MKKYFCTLFDKNYLVKGIAMLESLQKYCNHSEVYVLCMDHITADTLDRLGLHNIICILLSDIEDEEIKKAKEGRTTAEYCWTLASCITWYVINKYKHIDHITYLDADIYFYSDINPLFEEIGSKSIVISEHRFEPRLLDRIINGRFCVQWVGFRRDPQGLACLSTWRQQCLEWCFYRIEDGKMGDQKYLDKWPELYSNCHILQNIGAGVAPWNYSQYEFTLDKNSRVMVDQEPVIFYHFHQFQILKRKQFIRLSDFYRLHCAEPNNIYLIYEEHLKLIIDKIANLRSNRIIKQYLIKALTHLKSGAIN